MPAALEKRGVGQRDVHRRLEDPQADRQIAGVLGEFGRSRLSLFVKLLEPRDDDAQKLDDDRRRDVGHDAERENGQLEHRPARKHVEEIEEITLALLSGALAHVAY